jgi:hypothetical protein
MCQLLFFSFLKKKIDHKVSPYQLTVSIILWNKLKMGPIYVYHNLKIK